jgi:predicted transcriptional regulator
MATSAAQSINLPRRAQTVRKYLRIVKYACGKNQGLTSVAKRFHCSNATVINAAKAFGMSYDEIKRRRSIPAVRHLEKQGPIIQRVKQRDMQIVDMYNADDAPTLEEIAHAFRLTRQRVHQVLREVQHKGIKIRKRRPTDGHWIERCLICSQMAGLASEHPLMTTQGIAQTLDIPMWKVYWHLSRLKQRGLVEPHFGHFRSERIIQAIKLYNSDPTMSAWKLGQRLGYKNLPGVFQELRNRGFGYLLAPRRGQSRPTHLRVVR